MKDIEIWKPVVGFEDSYNISSFGRVKSLDRIVTCKDGRKLKYDSIILSQNKDGRGYLGVIFTINKVQKRKNTHQVMAEAFLGHIPCGQVLVVDHIDNDKLNNHLNNLQVISQRQNSTKDKNNGSSKYIGVHWNKARSKWRSAITHNQKQIYLGYFENEIEASDAYQTKLKEITDC